MTNVTSLTAYRRATGGPNQLMRDELVQRHIAAAKERRMTDTGYAGSTLNIPDGWATVMYFPYQGSDQSADYTGPVVEDTPDWIVLDIYGEHMTFPKSRVLVTR